MPKKLSEIMKSLPAKRRARIEAETAKEVADVMTLRELRKVFELSQDSIAKSLQMEQESVSRLERRTDLLLSTMRKYIEAMGGDLKLVAEFPNRAPVQIRTFAELRGKRSKSERRERKRA